MPTNRDVVLDTLSRMEGGLCDDCLSSESGVTPRQQIHQIATSLQRAGRITREKRQCPSCGRHKLVSSTGAALGEMEMKPPSPKPSQGRPWYWEGNVQGQVVSHLAGRGGQILAVANTRSRAPGKDIVALTPEGRKLWVSVKGWPEQSPNTQARHWFSQALFDMILYRDENPDADLAIALPAGFTTYENLFERIRWFRRTLPLKMFWVEEDGRVSEE